MRDNIDARQADKITAFKCAAIVGTLQEGVVVTIRGSKKVVKSFSSLRKMWKAELYRYAKLVPRPSDVDAMELVLQNDGVTAQALEPERLSDFELSQNMMELADVATMLRGVLESNAALTSPIVSSMAAATTMNNVMMSFLSALGSRSSSRRSLNSCSIVKSTIGIGGIPKDWLFCCVAMGQSLP
jgi:hypothetical protein